MARLIFFSFFLILLYYVLSRLLRGLFGQHGGKNEPEELVQDPHCQTYIPRRLAIRKRLKGQEFYFCSPECLKKYLEKQEKG